MSDNKLSWIANCCQCGRIIDTREQKDGGDSFGCEAGNGSWTCSFECWETEVDAQPREVPSETTEKGEG